MTNKNVIFGFKKYPHRRETPVPTAFDWLNGKKNDDDFGSKYLWRVHNKIYDLRGFKHPGGSSFIEMTQGTDITELFESSHPDIVKARNILKHYYVRDENSERNSSTFSFKDNEFYSVLRSRVWSILKEKGSGPTLEILRIHDILLAMFLTSIFLATSPWSDDIWLLFTFVSGFLLALLANCAHNFFHQRDNWRMYSFDLTTHSSFEWRITHAYSHHTFPNTINDYEITAFEPFVRYLPQPKGFLMKILTALSMVLVFSLAMLMVVTKRAVLIMTLQRKLRWENTLPILLTLLLAILRAIIVQDGILVPLTVFSQAVWLVAGRICVMYCVCSFSFLHISLSAGHHHPDVWHAGDSVPQSLATIDWGVFQLISVGRRPLVDSSLTLSCMSFGMHQLHHLFPTVDHSKLPLLEKTLRDTCKEFAIDIFSQLDSSDKTTNARAWEAQRTFSPYDGWIGMICQAMRTMPSATNFPLFAQPKK